MSSQHLSDEAVAAFADGVLSGHARDRAARHSAACPECAYAVAVQREAVWALRAAPAPSLPIGLIDRLRAVPTTTPLTAPPLSAIPSAVAEDGSALFSALAPMAAAAFVPSRSAASGSSRSAASGSSRAASRTEAHRLRPIALTAAAVAAAGLLAVSSDVSPAGGASRPATGQLTGVVQGPAGSGAGSVAVPVDARVSIGR